MLKHRKIESLGIRPPLPIAENMQVIIKGARPRMIEGFAI